MLKNPNGRGTATASQMVKVTPGRMYRFSSWIKTQGVQGDKGRGAAIAVEVYDKNKKLIPWSGFFPGGLRGSRGWWKSVSQTSRLKRNIFGPVDVDTVNVLLYVHSKEKKLLGKAWWDDVCFEPVSMTCHVLKPSYKLSLTDKRPELKLDIQTWPEDFGLKLSETQIVIRIHRAKSKTNVYNKKLNIKEKSFIFTDNMRFLTNGKYNMTVAFQSKADEKELWKEEFPVKRITSFKNYPVYVNQADVTIVDNKPFFPLGVYSRNHTYYTGGNDMLVQLNDYFKNSPFNTVLSYDMLPVNVIKEFQRHGKKIILSVKNYFNAIVYHPNSFHSEPEEVPAMKKVIRKWKKYPALLAWYTNDEKGLDLLPNHLKHYFAINETDRNHPSFNLHNMTDDFPELLNTCDIIGVDCYPVPRQSISKVAEEIKAAVAAVKNSRPVWAVLQISNLAVHYGERMPEGRPPTEQEFRVMSWLAVCNGANGIIYYCFHDCLKDKKYKLEEYWPKYCRVAKEISSFANAIISGERKPDVKFTDTIIKSNSPHDLYWRSAIHGNKIYIFAAKGDKGECSVNLVINEKIKNLEVMTLGKDKSFESINKFKPFVRDFFKKSTVKVYKGELIK